MEHSTANDGFAAMAELERAWHRHAPYDIVFIDQMMPGMSGEKLAQRIRGEAHLSEAKLVLVSSSGRYAMKDGFRALFDAILDKPVRQHELFDALLNVYGKKLGLSAAKLVQRHAVTIEKTERPLQILLAEDNRINQQFAVQLLKKAGHAVTVAENGHQAVDQVRDHDFDVVLMDIQMPGLDGVEATRQIRALPAPKNAICIVAMTAHAMAGARQQYLSAGMNDYISKPVKSEDLLAMLGRIAEGVTKTAPQSPKPEKFSAPAALMLDNEKLKTLQDIMPGAALPDFLRGTLREIDAALAKIHEAHETSDCETVARQAHMIVSSAGNAGAAQLSALARDVEHACRSGDLVSCGKMIAGLDGAVAAASVAIQTWVDREGRVRRKQRRLERNRVKCVAVHPKNCAQIKEI